MTAGALRVLIADDHSLYRRGLRAMLSSLTAMDVVGEAGTGSEAVALAADLRPDVVVMDINMPELNGIEATRRIIQDQPGVGVIILTMFEDDDSVFAAMRAGARGYVVKGSDEGQITRAIEAVAQGEVIFGPAIAERVMRFFGQPRAAREAFPQLTERENEVLELIAQGLGNASIARRLVVSDKTVRNHASNIFAKLQVADRAEAIVRARQAGYGEKF